MRRHIYDDDIWYSLGLRYVKLVTRLCYRRFHVSGWERVPRDGSVILVSNHTSALMDPLVMLLAEGKKVVFMARADIFRKPAVRAVLTWLRILPIYRIRDGYDAVKGNDRAIAQAVEVVTHRVPLCLYPEGTHRSMHSLLRLSKGIFHIALEADAQQGSHRPVYIVPVGIEYSDYFRFRADVEMQVGEPINVSQFAEDFLRQSKEDERKETVPQDEKKDTSSQDEADDKAPGEVNKARLMNALRERLTAELQSLFTCLPDDEDYDALWELTQLRTAQSRPLSVRESVVFNQREASHLLDLRSNNPTEWKELCTRALAFKCQREERAIAIRSTALSRLGSGVIGRALGLLVTLPLFILCGALSWPAWLLTTIVARNAHDAAWKNTWRFAVCLLLMPVLVLVVALVAFSHLHWGWALALTLLAAASIPVVYDWVEQFRRFVSDCRWLRKPSLRAELRSLLGNH
ncbi:MAG: 1-acyl-sn-glycerol-3-phosphate acyltransferase [Bacteroidaceae bacterium]|nr:1-acyl-sn-glycerol-3-phosphate acyltransferase [Bacteroidaceae bacterium]